VPEVNCDRTPPAAVLPHVPLLKSATDIPANDEWKGQVIGLYRTEVAIREAEHKCWDALRASGVIR
jgi:hypothetical protein